MTLKFDGKTIPGTTGPLQIPSPLGRSAKASFAGVNGEALIAMGGSGRDITVEHLLHDEFNDAKKVLDWLKKMDKWATWTKPGTIVVTGNVPRTEKDCVFIGYEQRGLPGQAAPGLLYDHAGTLDGGWFVNLQLRWRQLLVGK